jgi:hypothetical protein
MHSKSAWAESYQGEQFLGYARKSARAESTKENNMLLKRTCFMHVLCECQFHMYNNCWNEISKTKECHFFAQKTEHWTYTRDMHYKIAVQREHYMRISGYSQAYYTS